MKELEEEFIKDGGKLKKWKLEELFTSSNGDFDIQQKHINGVGEFVISSGVQSLGLIGKTDISAKVFPQNTITVDMFGNVYYRDFSYKMVTHARVFSLSFKDNSITPKAALFISSCMQFLRHMFSYSDMASWDKIKKQKMSIYLPTKNNKPAVSYMEKYIHVLEEERIHVLEDYLKVSNLDDYNLTKDELMVLSKVQNKEIQFKEFPIMGDKGVFEVKNTHSILQEWITPNSGTFPYVTAGESNNSVSAYISYDTNWLENGNSIMIGGKTLVITYQEQDYFSNDSHNLALYLKNKVAQTKRKQLFLVTSLCKKLKPKYSWGDSISKTKIKSDTIGLPLNSKNEIDYDLMEIYIKAIEKKVIQNVITWKDKEIKKTKEFVFSEK